MLELFGLADAQTRRLEIKSPFLVEHPQGNSPPILGMTANLVEEERCR